MDRRQFIRTVSAAGAVAGVSLDAGAATETRTVRYDVEGFTCVTCAVGLETMLKDQRGVTRVSASYPNRSVEIGFDRTLTTEQALVDFIAQCGFTVRTA